MTAWALDADSGVRWRDWDGEVVVYIGARASTHLLSPEASQIFLMLADGVTLPSAATDDKQEDQSGLRPADPETDVSEFIQATLLEFVRLGLARAL